MIIKRYIHLEIIKKQLWIAGLLFLIYASDKFVDYLSDAAAGKISGRLVFHLLYLKVISVLPKLLPVTLFLGVMLTYSRLINDNELAVMSSSGVSQNTHLKIVAQISLYFCLLVGTIALYVAPWAEGKVASLKDHAQRESDITGVTAGQFREFNKNQGVVYIESISKEGDEMENVFLQLWRNDKLAVMASDKARFEHDEISGQRYLVFEKGRRYVSTPDLLDFRITEYETYGVFVDTGTNLQPINTKLEAIPSALLITSNQTRHKAELQWRISSVLSCMLLALLAVLLSQISLTQKKRAMIMIGMLIYLLYSNLLGISKTLLQRDDIPAFIGLWWVHLLLILLMLSIYYFPQIRYWFRAKNK